MGHRADRSNEMAKALILATRGELIGMDASGFRRLSEWREKRHFTVEDVLIFLKTRWETTTNDEANRAIGIMVQHDVVTGNSFAVYTVIGWERRMKPSLPTRIRKAPTFVTCDRCGASLKTAKRHGPGAHKASECHERVIEKILDR